MSSKASARFSSVVIGCHCPWHLDVEADKLQIFRFGDQLKTDSLILLFPPLSVETVDFR